MSMKKLFVLGLLVFTILAVTANASAASIVSLDTMFGGSIKNTGFGASELDYSQSSISLGTTINRYEFGLQYGVGTETKSGVSDIDTQILYLKAGYVVINNLATKVDVSLMNGDLKTNSNGTKGELNINFLGVGLTQFFSEKFFMTANYGTGISGFAKSDLLDTDNNVSALTYGLTGNYLVTKNIIVTLAYGLIQGTIDDNIGGVKLGSTTTTLSGYTLSVAYLF
jgi:hypothetical protein